MNRIVTGQALLILCCGFYLIWWYRGFRLGMNVNRVGGINGLFLLVTAVLGIAGLICCLFSTVEKSFPEKVNPVYIAVGGTVLYILSLLVTRYLFNRVVTTELILIIGWTTLEMEMINRLNAGGFLTDSRFIFMCIVIATAFIRSCSEYVETHIFERIRLADMAGSVGYTESYISRQFKKETGESLFDYINRRKVELAKRLLKESPISVSELSDRLAFASPSYFSSLFRKFAGMSPVEYQNSRDGKPYS